MTRILRFFRDDPFLAWAFVLVLAVFLFFAARFTMSAVYWSDPRHADQTPAGWMTPRYVARSWDVPPEVIGEALSLTADGSGRRVTLAELAAARGMTVEALSAELVDAILAFREARRD